ncbi:MAG: hypothetical protein INR65_05615 [Gluconacetobacter diazotrophicus]|nr:hypothetical protein [Gluconacetobacter diazotrophicus]
MLDQLTFSVAPVDPRGAPRHERAVHDLSHDAAVQLLVAYHDAELPAALDTVTSAAWGGSGSHVNMLTGKVALVIRH